jgi:hypothetical protein
VDVCPATLPQDILKKVVSSLIEMNILMAVGLDGGSTAIVPQSGEKNHVVFISTEFHSRPSFVFVFHCSGGG